MRVLFLHCNSIKFKPTKRALKEAEEISKKEVEVKNCLVCFTAVEKSDEAKPSEIVKEFVKNVRDVASQVKTNTIVLYPYAHLSSQLASPTIALNILKEIRKEISKNFYLVSAPFGWYKSFSIDVKGHPLSELSREIGKDDEKRKEVRIDFHAELPKELSEHARLQKLARIGKLVAIEKDKLAKSDHRILGQKLELFTFQEVSPGMVFFLPKGMIIRNELINFLRNEQNKRGYKEILTPLLLHSNVWEISGHMKHFSDAMFFTKIDNSIFGLKPMNCPGAIIVYKTQIRSYKDLPLRLSEFGLVNRNELSGVLAGLFRMRSFTQDDAHIFIREDQIEEEVSRVMDLIHYFYTDVFNFSYHVELSTRPKKFMGDKRVWDLAEKTLENILKKKRVRYKINKGEGAFYGPKIDFHIKDSLGRIWQLATIQLDFQLPEKFDLSYIDEKGKRQRPIIIHRVVYGSIERFMGILVEHYQGNFPLWLAPIQVRVISFTDRNIEYAKKIESKLKEEGIRVDSDLKAETVDYKVREAQIQKIPYTIVVGNKEEKSKTIAVRPRGKNAKVRFGVKVEEFIKEIKKEIKRKNSRF